MAGTMAIGNAVSVNLAENVTVTATKENSVSFKKIMGDSLGENYKLPQPSSNIDISTYSSNGDKIAKNGVKDKLETQSVNEKPVQNKETVTEKCEEVKEQVKDEIKEKLGVTDEELEEKMAELGFTDVNLFNPQDVFKLCLTLGNAEEMDLLTNDSLYQAITEIMDDLNTMLTSVTETYGVVVLDAVLESAKPVDAEEETEKLLVTSEKTKTVDDPKITEESVKDVSTGIQNTQIREKDEQTEHKLGEDNPNLNQSEQTQHFAPTENTATLEQTPSFATSTTQSVMEQMIEGMKLEISPEVTELKMQLHPESLGNVTVQLTAKEGAVTASFTAQNEVVKNALETQMIQLKETLQEKGIQVEAVEVKVDAGAYNEQYQDAKDNESKEAFERELKKNQTRRINLSDYTDASESGEISEEEELTVKIMKENGNSLDYSA